MVVDSATPEGRTGVRGHEFQSPRAIGTLLAIRALGSLAHVRPKNRRARIADVRSRGASDQSVRDARPAARAAGRAGGDAGSRPDPPPPLGVFDGENERGEKREREVGRRKFLTWLVPLTRASSSSFDAIFSGASSARVPEETLLPSSSLFLSHSQELFERPPDGAGGL